MAARISGVSMKEFICLSLHLKKKKKRLKIPESLLPIGEPWFVTSADECLEELLFCLTGIVRKRLELGTLQWSKVRKSPQKETRCQEQFGQ